MLGVRVLRTYEGMVRVRAYRNVLAHRNLNNETRIIVVQVHVPNPKVLLYVYTRTGTWHEIPGGTVGGSALCDFCCCCLYGGMIR